MGWSGGLRLGHRDPSSREQAETLSWEGPLSQHSWNAPVPAREQAALHVDLFLYPARNLEHRLC